METSILLLLLTALMLQIKAEKGLVLDKNQFLIYNHNYPSARLAQWGQKYSDAGTYEHGLALNQLWTLEPHSYQKGCYYIVNEYWPNWRIADSKHNFYVFDGPHWDDQLFRFVPSGSDGFFYIYNCLYTNDRIAKYGVQGLGTEKFLCTMAQDTGVPHIRSLPF